MKLGALIKREYLHLFKYAFVERDRVFGDLIIVHRIKTVLVDCYQYMKWFTNVFGYIFTC